MSSREANIGMLNHAIASLNDDAEGMHELVARSTEDLERVIAASDRAADNAARTIEALEPMAELMEARYRDSAEMLGEARMASQEQREASAAQAQELRAAVAESLEAVGSKTDATCSSLGSAVSDMKAEVSESLGSVTAKTDEACSNLAQTSERLEASVAEALDSVASKTDAACDELRKTVDDAFDEMGKAQAQAFDDAATKAQKEHERTRDELQTDMLGFKNVTSARLDTLEAEVVKAQGAIKDLEGKLAESADATSKKLLLPVYAAIAIGVIDLVCLVVLLTR